MICVTVSIYALVRELGAEAALAEFQRQLKEPLDPSTLPAVRFVTRLRGVAGDVALHVDVGGSAVAKMRSRSAHVAYCTGAEVWMSVDDDVECTFETCKALYDAVQGDTPRVVIAPCWLRRSTGGIGAETINVAFDDDAYSKARVLSEGVACWPAIAGGFGLVATNRAALERTLRANTQLAYRDDDGETRIGLFYEDLSAGRWWGEDLSFFRRLPSEVVVEVLASGYTAHAAMVLDCKTIGEQTRMNLLGFRPVIEAEIVEPTKDELPGRGDLPAGQVEESPG